MPFPPKAKEYLRLYDSFLDANYVKTHMGLEDEDVEALLSNKLVKDIYDQIGSDGATNVKETNRNALMARSLRVMDMLETRLNEGITTCASPLIQLFKLLLDKAPAETRSDVDNIVSNITFDIGYGEQKVTSKQLDGCVVVPEDKYKGEALIKIEDLDV